MQDELQPGNRCPQVLTSWQVAAPYYPTQPKTHDDTKALVKTNRKVVLPRPQCLDARCMMARGDEAEPSEFSNAGLP
jgi:hypothetical protein